MGIYFFGNYVYFISSTSCPFLQPLMYPPPSLKFMVSFFLVVALHARAHACMHTRARAHTETERDTGRERRILKYISTTCSVCLLLHACIWSQGWLAGIGAKILNASSPTLLDSKSFESIFFLGFLFSSRACRAQRSSDWWVEYWSRGSSSKAFGVCWWLCRLPSNSSGRKILVEGGGVVSRTSLRQGTCPPQSWSNWQND